MNLFVLLFVFVFGIIGSYSSKFSEKNLFWLFVIVLAIIIGGRSISVPDTDQYLEFYQLTLSSSILDIPLYSYEIGFQLLTKILKLITNGSSFFYFGIIVLINSYFLFKSFSCFTDQSYPSKKSSGTLINQIKLQEFLLLYFSYWGLYYTGIVLRAGIAMSILIYLSTLLCSPYISLKKWSAIFLLAIISCSFHITALLGIIALIIFYISKKMTMRSYLLLFLLICIILFGKVSFWIVDMLDRNMPMIFSLIEDTDFAKLQAYSNIDASIKISFRFLFCLLIGLFFIICKRMQLYYYKYLNVYIVGLFLGALFSAIEAFSRIMDFFVIYSFILISMRLSTINSFKIRFSIMFSIVLIQLLFVYRIIIGL